LLETYAVVPVISKLFRPSKQRVVSENRSAMRIALSA
jgi:hypothetical protein